MPSHWLRTFLLTAACGYSALLSAQVASIDMPDPELVKQPKLILLSGLAPETGQHTYRTFFLSVERPFGPYHHAGIHYTAYLPEIVDENYYYYAQSSRDLRKGSYEVGLFSKFFMHGRLSGRRSHLYYGPDIRFGLRKMATNEGFDGTGYVTHNYEESTIKFMFCIGGQFQLGHGAIDWCLPLGLEYNRSNLRYTTGYYSSGSGSKIHVCIVPSIALGIRL